MKCLIHVICTDTDDILNVANMFPIVALNVAAALGSFGFSTTNLCARVSLVVPVQ